MGGGTGGNFGRTKGSMLDSLSDILTAAIPLWSCRGFN